MMMMMMMMMMINEVNTMTTKLFAYVVKKISFKYLQLIIVVYSALSKHFASHLYIILEMATP